MKENPAEKDIKRDMQPGRLILDGFLGDDTRQLEEIIDEDREILRSFDVDAVKLAKTMRDLTRAGMKGLGSPVEKGGYTVEVEEWMGWLGCPFKDAKRAAKRISTVTRVATGETMKWSDLHIHLIEKHVFFQGRGSSHRLEPEELIRFLGLDQSLKNHS